MFDLTTISEEQALYIASSLPEKVIFSLAHDKAKEKLKRRGVLTSCDSAKNLLRENFARF